MIARSVTLAFFVAALAATPASAAKKSAAKKRMGRPVAAAPVEELGASAARTPREAPDELYRRRGYGIGGLVFGRNNGLAQAGACADLAFAKPRGCGPRGGYGIYGNGLGYGFGF